MGAPEGAAVPAHASSVRRWLREPVLHFVLIGAVLFALYGRTAPPGGDGTRIVVTRALTEELARQHAARWGRPPTGQELAGLVEAHVRDEVLYREGVALGLDRDDPVIRRRVRQKLEVMTEEALAGEAPGDAELAAYLARHADRYARPGTVAFDQILFSGSQDPVRAAREIAEARQALARGADPGTLGAPTLLPRRMDDAPVDLVARDFGAEFAARLATVPQGEWSGPVRSGYGLHLVRVTGRSPATTPPLDAVRDRVARDWESERRARTAEEGFARIRSRYEVVVEPLPAGEGARP
jgi:hypothetical protein